MKQKTIRDIRIKEGMSQSQFCRRFHIGLRALQSWEQGLRKCPEYVVYLIDHVIQLEKEIEK